MIFNLGISFVGVEHAEFNGKGAVVGNDGEGEVSLQLIVGLNVFDPALVVLNRVDGKPNQLGIHLKQINTVAKCQGNEHLDILSKT